MRTSSTRCASAPDALARLASVPAAAVRRALFGPAATPAPFVDAAARLQDIESGLAQRARRNPMRKGFRT
jgi:hypothetical protein